MAYCISAPGNATVTYRSSATWPAARREIFGSITLPPKPSGFKLPTTPINSNPVWKRRLPIGLLTVATIADPAAPASLCRHRLSGSGHCEQTVSMFRLPQRRRAGWSSSPGVMGRCERSMPRADRFAGKRTRPVPSVSRQAFPMAVPTLAAEMVTSTFWKLPPDDCYGDSGQPPSSDTLWFTGR